MPNLPPPRLPSPPRPLVSTEDQNDTSVLTQNSIGVGRSVNDTNFNFSSSASDTPSMAPSLLLRSSNYPSTVSLRGSLFETQASNSSSQSVASGPLESYPASSPAGRSFWNQHPTDSGNDTAGGGHGVVALLIPLLGAASMICVYWIMKQWQRPRQTATTTPKIARSHPQVGSIPEPVDECDVHFLQRHLQNSKQAALQAAAWREDDPEEDVVGRSKQLPSVALPDQGLGEPGEEGQEVPWTDAEAATMQSLENKFLEFQRQTYPSHVAADYHDLLADTQFDRQELVDDARSSITMDEWHIEVVDVPSPPETDATITRNALVDEPLTGDHSRDVEQLCHEQFNTIKPDPVTPFKGPITSAVVEDHHEDEDHVAASPSNQFTTPSTH